MYLNSPGVATDSINFIVVDWPSQQWTGGGYTDYKQPGAWTALRDAFYKPCGRIHWCALVMLAFAQCLLCLPAACLLARLQEGCPSFSSLAVDV
jgi:hypothetical protein